MSWGTATGKSCGAAGVRLITVLAFQSLAPAAGRLCQLASLLSAFQELATGRAVPQVLNSLRK